MLYLNNIAINYGSRVLFKDANLKLIPDARYGVVGANGAGKSTLLKAIAKREELSSGSVDIPNSKKLGFLEQDHFRFDTMLILEVVISGNKELWEAMQTKELLLAKTDLTMEEGLQLAELEATIAKEDGYSAESLAQSLLQGLGIEEENHLEPLSSLSGGYKLRVLLAQLLFQQPDIMLLDEPTNHLDIVAITWLESYLCKSFTGTLLVVSHDQKFLNNVSTHILDIDYQTITAYTGNYAKFLLQKEATMEQQLRKQAHAEKQVAHLQSFVDKFGAKASKAKQAKSRLKMIDRIETVEVGTSTRIAPKFNFSCIRKSGKQVLKADNISKAFLDKQVLNNVGFTVARGDKVAILGPNGIGKSTLLKILLEQLAPDSGEFTWGFEARLSYFAQESTTKTDKDSVIDWLTKNSRADDKSIRNTLGNLLFTKDEVHKNLGKLSGGELARLEFAKITLEQGNVLVLDEPTNHLDMESIEALAQALSDYDGTVIFVSHDRNFVEIVAKRLILVTRKGVSEYNLKTANLLESIYAEYLDS